MRIEPDIVVFGERHYSLGHFANGLGRSKSTVQKWLREGRGPEIWRLGRMPLVTEKSAKEFIKNLKGE